MQLFHASVRPRGGRAWGGAFATWDRAAIGTVTRGAAKDAVAIVDAGVATHLVAGPLRAGGYNLAVLVKAAWLCCNSVAVCGASGHLGRGACGRAVAVNAPSLLAAQWECWFKAG